ncbi:MAG: radical SAM/SPASM domain-containing protein [Candidatus Omnitrophota bacterium]
MEAQILVNDAFMQTSFLKKYARSFLRRNAKFFSRLLLKKEKYIAPVIPEDFYARIEITNACNYNCKYCPHSNMKRPLGIMDEALYRKIIDECLAGGIRMINLTSFGESMLDKNLLSKIKYAKDKGTSYLYLTTNGSLMDARRAEELIDVGLDEVRVSIDAVSSSEYSQVRSEYNYNSVVKNITRLIEIKKEKKAVNPKITVCFIKRQDNKHQVDDFVNTWKDKVDVIHIQTFHNWAAGIAGGVAGNFVPCKRLWLTLNVYWDGTVGLCCADIDGKCIVGDFKTSTLEEIWNSGEFQDARKKNLKNDQDFICARCSLPERDSLLWIKKVLTG